MRDPPADGRPSARTAPTGHPCPQERERPTVTGGERKRGEGRGGGPSVSPPSGPEPQEPPPRPLASVDSARPPPPDGRTHSSGGLWALRGGKHRHSSQAHMTLRGPRGHGQPGRSRSFGTSCSLRGRSPGGGFLVPGTSVPAEPHRVLTPCPAPSEGPVPRAASRAEDCWAEAATCWRRAEGDGGGGFLWLRSGCSGFWGNHHRPAVGGGGVCPRSPRLDGRVGPGTVWRTGRRAPCPPCRSGPRTNRTPTAGPDRTHSLCLSVPTDTWASGRAALGTRSTDGLGPDAVPNRTDRSPRPPGASGRGGPRVMGQQFQVRARPAQGP